MATIEITADNFNEVVANNPTVVLDFWATWCGPCKMFGPIFETASEAHPEVVFGKIDTDAQQELAGAFNIRSVPTLAVVRDNIMVFRESGALPAGALEEVLTKAQALDMDAIRADIAAQQAQQQQQQQDQ